VSDSSINTGAKITVAARALNMSEIEVAGMVEGLQRQAKLKKGIELTPEQAADAVLARLRKVYAVNQEMPADIDKLLTIPNEQVQFGEDGNQDELQNFGGVDKQGRIKNVGQAASERDKVKGKRDPNVFLRNKMVGRDKEGKKQFGLEEVFIPEGQAVPDEFKDQAILRDFGLRIAGRDNNGDDIVVPFREEVAPAQNILKQELSRLNEGINLFGAEAFGDTANSARGVGPDITGGPIRPGFRDPNIVIEGGKPYTADPLNIANVAGRIEDDLRPGRQAEAALARELVMADAQGPNTSEIEKEAERRLRLEFEDVFEDAPNIGRRGINAAMPIDAREVRKAAIMQELGGFSPQGRQDMIEANDWKANAEAQERARMRFGINGGGAQADAAIARIGQIKEIGNAKIADDFDVVKQVPGRQVDPKALPINLNEQYNIPTSSPIEGQLNAGQQWLAGQDPGFREDGRIFGDFPQVGINEQLNNAEKAIRNIKIKGKQVNPDLVQIKNVDGLQAAVDNIINLGIANRQGFFDKVDGKNVNNPNPGITQVLNKARMNDNQQGNLARALMMVELAGGERRDMGEDTRFFDEVDFNNGAPIARINREKIEGKDLKAALQRLDGMQADPPLNKNELAQARMPFQGGIAGQEIPRAAFVRGADRHLNREGLIRKHGAINGKLAADVIDRREQQAGVGADGFGMRGDFNVVAAPEMARVKVPDPWQTRPATGGGISQEKERRMSNSMLNQLAELNSGPTQGPRPSANFSNPGIKPDGPSNSPRRVRQEADYRQSVRNLGRVRGYSRNAAIAGGSVLGLAGLDGLIGGERNKREEEVYQ